MHEHLLELVKTIIYVDKLPPVAAEKSKLALVANSNPPFSFCTVVKSLLKYEYRAYLQATIQDQISSLGRVGLYH